MLKPPYTSYNRLFVYYLSTVDIPPIKNPELIGVWVEDNKAILFFHQNSDSLVDSICQKAGCEVIYQAELDYHDWEAGVEVTTFATDNLVISPVWEDELPIEGKEKILLDPSVIFGSGFHPSTRMCLDILESLMRNSSTPVRSVLDLGTGTGILAIAAAKLGVERVVCLDNNPLAVAVAENNVCLNNCDQVVEVVEHDLSLSLPDVQGFDLVITNLYKTLLLELFNNSDFWRGNWYIISGFIPSMEAELLAGLPMNRVKMCMRAKQEKWRAWLLQSTS